MRKTIQWARSLLKQIITATVDPLWLPISGLQEVNCGFATGNLKFTKFLVQWSKVLARPFPKGTVPFGGSNVPFGSASKETMCPLAPPQNQPIFNSHLNYLNLKTVWALSIELSEHWAQLKCFVNSGTHATNGWSDKSLHSRWGVWSCYYLCPLVCKFWWEHCNEVICRYYR